MAHNLAVHLKMTLDSPKRHFFAGLMINLDMMAAWKFYGLAILMVLLKRLARLLFYFLYLLFNRGKSVSNGRISVSSTNKFTVAAKKIVEIAE